MKLTETFRMQKEYVTATRLFQIAGKRISNRKKLSFLYAANNTQIFREVLQRGERGDTTDFHHEFSVNFSRNSRIS